jgi:hypothetical protein
MKFKQLEKMYSDWLILQLSGTKYTARKIGTNTLLIASSPDKLNSMIKAVR